MAKTNIESFVNPDGTRGEVWNPAKGCNGPGGVQCSYCYGCRIVKRLGYAEKVAMAELNYNYGCPPWPCEKEYDQLVDKIESFKPHFFEYVYAQKLRVKPTMYFFSMSNPADWEESWYNRIVEKIARHMKHTFIVLTKRPEIYKKYTFPHNTWLGVTCTTQLMLNQFECNLSNDIEINNILFLSIEPIQEKIKISGFMRTQQIGL